MKGIQLYREPWSHTPDGSILDCTGETIFLPGPKPTFNTTEMLAKRAAVCVSALRSLNCETVARTKFIVRPDRDHVILAAKSEGLVEWCKEVLEEAGYGVTPLE